MFQVECAQLHAFNDAAKKVGAKEKWQLQKQQRQVEFDRDVVQQRELTCALNEKIGQRFDERLRTRAN
jgi:hypothetical protein